MVRHLVSLGIPVDKTDGSGMTPLSLASRNALDIVSVLLEVGADVNTEDLLQQTPLHKAASVGALSTLKLLVEAGARVDVRDYNNLTAFGVADEVGQTECAVFLWENGSSAQSSVGLVFGSLEWKRSTFSNKPSARYSHKTCVVGKTIYVCGGHGIRRENESDLYILDTTEEYSVSLARPDFNEDMVWDATLSSPIVTISDGLKAFCNDTVPMERVSAVIANVGYSYNGQWRGYFEVTIHNVGSRNEIGIGLVSKGYSVKKHPGWQEFSYGYHSDDGRVFHNCGSGTAWGPMYGTGDVIGCGVVDEGVFWTKNGKLLGIAYDNVPHDVELFPFVGLTSEASIEVAFDNRKRPFKYNFKATRLRWRELNIPSNFQHFATWEEGPMLPLGNGKILFWVGTRMATFDTSLCVWEDVEVKNKLRYGDGFSHIIGSTLYTFLKIAGGLFCLDLVNWEWSSWEASEELKQTLQGFRHIYCSPVKEKLFVWGDSDPTIYVYDTIEKQWSESQPGGRGPPFQQYSCTAIGSQILTFGGWDSKKQKNEVFILDTQKLNWYKPHVSGLAVPKPRNAHSAVTIEEKMYCIGGWDGHTYLNDVDILECSSLCSARDPLFQYYFNNQSFSDITLFIHGRVIPAHKIILASRSQYFRERFSRDPKMETLDMTNEVNSFNLLYALVEYLYTEQFNIETIEIPSFLMTVSKITPEFKKILTEKLVLTRVSKISSRVYTDMNYAWETRCFSDITIMIGETPFHLHKAIICSRCPFFRALLSTFKDEVKQTDSTTPRSTLSLNEDPLVFQAIFEYIYTNNIVFTEENDSLVVPILISANQYSVLGCKELMEDIIGCNLDEENVLSLALVAEQHQAPRLAKSCWDYLSHPQNLARVSSHPDYLLYGEQVMEKLKAMHQ
eukprot:TRINITY_DN6836_c0_g5_i3.p1 TRINITY_DN6836_c0_g5~~TRINITY_DN6836_c0_g5_i3.p1  ORF type:complete len:899 (-),score=135.57 TRINITY_DN6836_c0_g5_i3:89-2785(-)